MLKLNIEVIPHSEQKAGITGEWWTDEAGVYQIRVSQMGDVRYELLHIVHEVVELAASLTHPEIMSDELTDKYDDEFLRTREADELPEGHEEPGFGIGCPYGRGHHLGTAAELMLCPEMGVNWIEYDNHVREVSKNHANGEGGYDNSNL
jgi:hypothetical protein